MRGKELDTLIEHELQLMLVEGFDKSPIQAEARGSRGEDPVAGLTAIRLFL